MSKQRKLAFPNINKDAPPEQSSAKPRTARDSMEMLEGSRERAIIPKDLLRTLATPRLSNSSGKSLRVTRSASRPANLWSFPQQREKFQHLLDNPMCGCGAGQEISYIVSSEAMDETALEQPESARKQERLPEMRESLSRDASEDLKLRRSLGALGIEVTSDKYTVGTKDHPSHEVKLPSMAPATRGEVHLVSRTLQSMLMEAGLTKTSLQAVAEKQPLQIEALLQLVRKEQEIYNYAFHEVIRQVSIECKERGRLLAEIRQSYAEMLSQVPKQVVSLHEELLSQRILDRRLLEELYKMHDCIGSMCVELSKIKLQDDHVYVMTDQLQHDVRDAMLAANKNGNLLSEYHQLYDYHKRRLHKEVIDFKEDCDTWSKLTLDLVDRVAKEYQLGPTVSVSNGANQWHTLAQHITTNITEMDTNNLLIVQKHMSQFCKFLDDYTEPTNERENNLLTAFNEVEVKVKETKLQFKERMLTQLREQKNFPQDDVLKIISNINDCRDIFNALTQAEHMEAVLEKGFSDVDNWTSLAIKSLKHYVEDDTTIKNKIELLNVTMESIRDFHESLEEKLSVECELLRNANNMTKLLSEWKKRFQEMSKEKEVVFTGDVAQFFQDLDALVLRLQRDKSHLLMYHSREEGGAGVSISPEVIKKQLHSWMTSSMQCVRGIHEQMQEDTSRLYSSMLRILAAAVVHITSGQVEEEGGSWANPPRHLLELQATITRLKNFAKKLALRFRNVTDTQHSWKEVTGNHEEQAARVMYAFQSSSHEWSEAARNLMQALGVPLLKPKALKDKTRSIIALKEQRSLSQKLDREEEFGETVYGLRKDGSLQALSLDSEKATTPEFESCNLHLKLINELQEQLIDAENRAHHSEARIIDLLTRLGKAEMALRNLRRNQEEVLKPSW